MTNRIKIINILDNNFSFAGSTGKKETLSSTFVLPNIPEKKIRNAARTHLLTRNDEILWMHDNTFFGSATESTVITEDFISLVYDDKQRPLSLRWEEISHVEFFDNHYYFYFDKEKQKHIRWPADKVLGVVPTLGKKLNGQKGKEVEIHDFFALVITEIANLFEKNELSLYQKIGNNFEKAENVLFLEQCDQYFCKYLDYAHYSLDIRLMRAEVFYKLGEFDKASSDINTILEIKDEDNDVRGLAKIFEVSAKIFRAKGDYYEALRAVQNAVSHTLTYNERSRLNLIFEDIYKAYVECFMILNYDKRKLLLVSDTITDLSKQSFSVVRKGNLPPIQFPVGHPAENELYIGHPYKADFYIPLGSYEGDLFRDREEEFCLLLQCLGATELTTTKRKTRSSDEFNETKSNVTLKGNVQIHKAKIQNTKNTDENTEQSMEAAVSKTQKFSPTKKPYLPDGLIWYKNEPSWQRLYQQRMNGSILEYHEQLSSTQKKILSNNEFRKIEAEYSNLVVSAELAVTNEIQHKFKQEEFAESTISVVFAPLGDLTDEETFSANGAENRLEKDTNSISAQEQEYIEMYKDAYEDFVITSDERRMLERRRQRSGISEEAAAILEARINWKNNFTEQEIEYMEEAKFCFENDDTITPKERRLLERIKVRLNLTDDRVAELEEFISIY